jgi:hypothetical protein
MWLKAKEKEQSKSCCFQCEAWPAREISIKKWRATAGLLVHQQKSTVIGGSAKMTARPLCLEQIK